MGRFVDSIIAYRILRLLVTPFEDTDAFRLGIIDAKGKELKKMAQLNTVAERDAYTILHRMVFRLKKIIEKVPVENKKLASFAAALSLIKEHANDKTEPIDLESNFIVRLSSNNLDQELNEINSFFKNKKTLTFKQFSEEVPANNAGSPGIAGLPPDEPPVSKMAQKKHVVKNLMFRRKKWNSL